MNKKRMTKPKSMLKRPQTIIPIPSIIMSSSSSIVGEQFFKKLTRFVTVPVLGTHSSCCYFAALVYDHSDRKTPSLIKLGSFSVTIQESRKREIVLGKKLFYPLRALLK